MKYAFLFLLLIIMSSFILPVGGGDPYKGCCRATPALIKIGDTEIFVPNVFTPNADGLNDVFRPFYDQKKIKIEQISISNGEGKFVWRTETFNPDKPFTAWNGRMGKDSTYTGLFNYTIVLADEKGTIKSFGGTACSVVCNPKVPVNIEDKSKCFFPMQHPRDSVSYKSVLYLEIDCLKK